ncbi:unnamed protein product [Adineta steineri]|uniref:Uncharacterized protein n=1 Tax=Adineta steineri TaxID=433720 RepID=A0A815TWW7_9BILA|nr:unnamed protein product [Adineta steineri]CAF1508551.1 unnamed protein product [Adineta steineri]CAF4100459.1 unnamed protein product [Adineta steineri]CAF4149059.1 unnamed protein product [Adineta steineri]
MSRYDFLETLRQSIFMVADLQKLQNEKNEEINSYTKNEAGIVAADALQMKKYKQTSMEIDILNILVPYVREMINGKIENATISLNIYSDHFIGRHIGDVIAQDDGP